MGDKPSDEDPRARAASELATVLHGQKRATEELDTGLGDLADQNADHEERLDALLARAEVLAAELEVELDPVQVEPEPAPEPEPEVPAQEPPTWEELLEHYDVGEETVTLDQLLTPEQCRAIDARMDAPLAREPWDRWDHAAVFGAALAGIIADWFCAPLGNPLSDEILGYGEELHDKEGLYRIFRDFQDRLADSGLAERFDWVRQLSEMKATHHGLPIDYSGPDFGGPHHRLLSAGHDLLRFMSAIWQIKNGQFVGVRFEDNTPIQVIKEVSHRGADYVARSDWGTAAVEYLLHVLADFFTKTSLPVPGMTLLRELPHREIRVFVAQMYKGINPWNPERFGAGGNPEGGYNLRHVLGQGVTTAVTHLIVWLYHLLRYRLPAFVARLRGQPVLVEAVPGLKLNELLAVAHTTVAAVNVGKVVVLQNPLLLNLPQVLMCTKQLASLSLKQLRRYDLRARWERNQLWLDEGWTALEASLEWEVVQVDEVIVVGAG